MEKRGVFRTTVFKASQKWGSIDFQGPDRSRSESAYDHTAILCVEKVTGNIAFDQGYGYLIIMRNTHLPHLKNQIEYFDCRACIIE